MTGVILMIVALILAGLLLLAVELCTPTFGVLAIAGVLCLGGGVYLCFTINPVAGLGSVLGLIVIVPLWLWVVVKVLIPRTFVGRILQLTPRTPAPGEGTPLAEAQKSLLGKQAVAETSLRPSGAIRVDGRRVIATARAGYIEKGDAVRIIQATGMNVVVEKVETPPE